MSREHRLTTAERLRKLSRRVETMEALVLPPRGRDAACTCTVAGEPCPTCRAWLRQLRSVLERRVSGMY